MDEPISARAPLTVNLSSPGLAVDRSQARSRGLVAVVAPPTTHPAPTPWRNKKDIGTKGLRAENMGACWPSFLLTWLCTVHVTYTQGNQIC